MARVSRGWTDDPAGLEGPELWLDTGDSDPFVPGDEALTEALGAAGIEVEHHRWAGGHDGTYWNEHWSDYLAFYGNALGDC